MVVIEMAQITPPIGFNLFVLQGMTGHDMGFIARAAVPMFLIMVLAVAVLVAFPGIATYLPSIMSAPETAYQQQQHRVHHSAQHPTYIEFRVDPPRQQGQ